MPDDDLNTILDDDANTPPVEDPKLGDDNTPPVDDPKPGDDTPPPEDPSPEAPDDGKNKGHLIPKSRYDSAKSRLTLAEQQNAQLAAKLAGFEKADSAAPDPAQVAEEKLTELDAQYAKALADGEHEKAAGFMRQARQLERDTFRQQLDSVANSTNERTREDIRYDAVLQSLEIEHPVTNPDSDQYDEDLVAELSELKSAFESTGLPASQALKRAAGYILGAAAPAPQAKPRTTDVKGNLRTAAQQPASLAAAGDNSDKGGAGKGIDIMKMSDTEFDKLTEADLARLRGDEL